MSTVSQSPYTFRLLLRDLVRYMRPYRRKFWIAFFLRASSDLVWLYPAWALSRIVDLLAQGSGQSVVPELINILIIWSAVSVYHFTTHNLGKYYGYQVAEGMGIDARVQAIRHLFRLDLAWHERENSGNKLKRITSGSNGLNRIVRVFFTNVIESTINAIGLPIVLFYFSPTIGIMTLGFMIIFYYLSLRLTQKASALAYAVHQQEEVIEGISFESLNNIRTIKSLAIHPRILALLKAETETARQKVRKRIIWFQTRDFVLNVVSTMYQVAGVGIFAWLILQGRLDLGILVLFLNYAGKIDSATFELSEVTHELVIAKIGVERLIQITQTQPTIDEQGARKPYPPDWEEIVFRQVSFAYQGESVLQQVDLTIKRGEKIGIVGLSGAGKSTLFQLLLDLYEDYEGEILVGGVSLREIDRYSYIDHVAAVLQETELFNTSLKDNITIAATANEDDLEQVHSVIRTSHLSAVADKLAHGIDTLVGEKGVKLSGGERQRLGIARALFRRPDLLLLDEATSSLDVDSEKMIQASLHEFFHQVTAVVIAHRLSTIREMDRILVLENGHIVEEGSFDQLIEREGIFASMWNKQSKA